MATQTPTRKKKNEFSGIWLDILENMVNGLTHLLPFIFYFSLRNFSSKMFLLCFSLFVGGSTVKI